MEGRGGGGGGVCVCWGGGGGDPTSSSFILPGLVQDIWNDVALICLKLLKLSKEMMTSAKIEVFFLIKNI